MVSRAPPRGRRDGLENIGVRAAAADVAAHPFTHFLLRPSRRGGEVGGGMAGYARLDFLQHCRRRADLAWRAIATLVTVAFDEGSLQRMELPGRAEPFDRGDGRPGLHDCEREAGVDPPSADEDGARAALAMIAPLLASGQVKMLAQRVEQRGPRIDFKFVEVAVHLEGNLDQFSRW